VTHLTEPGQTGIEDSPLAWMLNKQLVVPNTRNPAGVVKSSSQIDSCGHNLWFRFEFVQEVIQTMVCVDEYGKNIGTLRNLFRDLQQAVVFAKQIIEFADEEYTCVGTYKWFCEKKNEYVEIKNL
jgi:hypothetical protein